MVAILALGAFANGGGNVVPPPVIPQVSSDNWSGPYIGLQLGYIKGTGDYKMTSSIDPSQYMLAENIKPSGFIGGLYVGYNKMLQNNWLAGIELAVNYTNIKKSKNLISTGPKLISKKQESKALASPYSGLKSPTPYEYNIGQILTLSKWYNK